MSYKRRDSEYSLEVIHLTEENIKKQGFKNNLISYKRGACFLQILFCTNDYYVIENGIHEVYSPEQFKQLFEEVD
jgi:hypothetical protein